MSLDHQHYYCSDIVHRREVEHLDKSKCCHLLSYDWKKKIPKGQQMKKKKLHWSTLQYEMLHQQAWGLCNHWDNLLPGPVNGISRQSLENAHNASLIHFEKHRVNTSKSFQVCNVHKRFCIFSEEVWKKVGWGQCCGIVSKATACDVSIPCMCQFVLWQLHFSTSHPAPWIWPEEAATVGLSAWIHALRREQGRSFKLLALA